MAATFAGVAALLFLEVCPDRAAARRRSARRCPPLPLSLRRGTIQQSVSSFRKKSKNKSKREAS
jgi:hypothetical protein